VFEEVGRESLKELLDHGLYPHSTILDIGCGSLRIGYWLINFLQPATTAVSNPTRPRCSSASTRSSGPT